MSGLFADRLPLRRASLAIALCLLAFLFAVESKAAWFGPWAGLNGDTQSAKAFPAVSPEVAKQHVAAPDPMDSPTAFASLGFALVPPPQAADLPLREDLLRSPAPRLTADLFLPSLFFRPPPADAFQPDCI